MTNEIRKEWKRHAAPFAFRWMASMKSKNKIHEMKINDGERIRRSLLELQVSEKDRGEMLKDLPLIEAAMATAQRVVSLDEKVRSLYASNSERIPELKSIVWVNPEISEEQPLLWLKHGAKTEESRKLGAQS
jgi:hypothetical protein